ncbi:MAG: YdgA family protein, partial [Steroidobacterales bacterium]
PNSLRFTVRSRIVHGPLPGFGPPALARIETEFVMDESVKKALAKVFGDRKPIEIVTLLDYGGDGVTHYSSPSFDHFPIGTKGETLSWKGFTASMEFGRDLAWFKMQGEAPGMEGSSPGGESVKMEQVAFGSNSELAFDDLYIGDGWMKIKAISVVAGAAEGPAAGKNVTMSGFDYSAKATRNKDFLDASGKFAIAGMDVEEMQMKDLHYDLSFNHLHGPTVAAIWRDVRKVLAQGVATPVGENGATIDKDMKRLGIALLEHEPELLVDRISFTIPEGDAKLSGRMHLVGFEAADLDGGNPMALVQKIDAKVDIDIAEGLLKKFSEKSGSAAQLDRQLAALEAHGYCTRSDGRVSTHIEFRQGALTFNGKAFSPKALVPPPAPQSGAKPPRDTTHT